MNKDIAMTKDRILERLKNELPKDHNLESLGEDKRTMTHPFRITDASGSVVFERSISYEELWDNSEDELFRRYSREIRQLKHS